MTTMTLLYISTLLIMLLIPTSGLQCYDKSVSTSGVESKLVNCTNKDHVCSIHGTSDTVSLQSCFAKIPLMGNGCKEFADLKKCQCETDGCNETMEKAALAGGRGLAPETALFYSLIVFYSKVK